MDDLVKRDGIYYKKFTDVPFTGNITGTKQGKIKNGKKEGPWVFYRDNGQLGAKGSYTHGKNVGAWAYYNDKGQLWTKLTFKDGKVVED